MYKRNWQFVNRDVRTSSDILGHPIRTLAGSIQRSGITSYIRYSHLLFVFFVEAEWFIRDNVASLGEGVQQQVLISLRSTTQEGTGLKLFTDPRMHTKWIKSPSIRSCLLKALGHPELRVYMGQLTQTQRENTINWIYGPRYPWCERWRENAFNGAVWSPDFATSCSFYITSSIVSFIYFITFSWSD